MTEQVKVLQGFIANTNGGSTHYLINNYRYMNKSKVQIDFLTFDDNLDFYNEITSLGANIYKITSFKKNPYLFIKDLKNIIKKNNYKFIYINMSSAVPAIYVLICKIIGVNNCIVHSHNTFIDSTSRYKRAINSLLHQIFKGILIKFPDYRFACSTMAGEWLFGKKNVENGKVQVLKNAIDAKKFRYSKSIRTEVRQSLGLEGKFVVGHIGRFCYQKNHDFLLDIFYEVYKNNKNAVLLLVGKGELEEDIRKKVRDLEMEDAVMFTGIRSDIQELLQAMDVFVLPSRFEGLGIVAIEAQAAGLRIFTSNQIPDEAKVTELLEKINLSLPAKNWADKIMYSKDAYERLDRYDEIVDAGYDINNSVKLLEDFYLSID